MNTATNTIKTRGELIRHAVRAALGLVLFGVGLHLTIQANIGAFPWDVFHLGLADKLGMKYGNVSIIVALLIIAADLLMKEKIGLGTVFDALIVGKVVDFCNWLVWIQPRQHLWSGLLMMIGGLFVLGFSQSIYMKAGLCCGPRDALLVALGKRLPDKVPIGAVSITILSVVLCFGWLLGGPIGIGTLISTFGTGICMQIAFQIVKFDPLTVQHQDLWTSMKIFVGKRIE